MRQSVPRDADGEPDLLASLSEQGTVDDDVKLLVGVVGGLGPLLAHLVLYLDVDHHCYLLVSEVVDRNCDLVVLVLVPQCLVVEQMVAVQLG